MFYPYPKSLNPSLNQHKLWMQIKSFFGSLKMHLNVRSISLSYIFPNWLKFKNDTLCNKWSVQCITTSTKSQIFQIVRTVYQYYSSRSLLYKHYKKKNFSVFTYQNFFPYNDWPWFDISHECILQINYYKILRVNVTIRPCC